MIRLFLILATLSAWADESAPVATVHFADGKSLIGSPAGYEEHEHLLWSSPYLRNESVRFEIPAVDRIDFDDTAQQPDELDYQAFVQLHQHYDRFADRLPAELLSFDENEVRLRTWYAGDLTLQRSMVAHIEVSSQPKALYSGPLPLEDWTEVNDESAWEETPKGLQTLRRGSIAQKFPDLPERLKISFEVSFDNGPYLALLFFADANDTSRPDNYYYLELRGSYVDFRKTIDGRYVRLGNNLRNRLDFDGEDSAQFDVYIDRQKGVYSLYANDEQMGIWNDVEPFVAGDWFHLFNKTGQSSLVKSYVIRPWDGELPEATDPGEVEELPGEGERIELRNGDTLLGEASSVQDEKLLVETEFAPVSVPLQFLRSFQITNYAERNEPRMWPGDVRAYFHDGGHVTLRMSKFTPTHVTGYSQAFGEASFDLRAFSRIEFNPYDDAFRLRRGIRF
ncbi:MAG: hypothetical protein Q7Q71_01825 [Verrucomicrobiota bacterium JB023]|nr:hypothetical protein [Verrucomicrobiota bacterium JB023]